MALAPPRRGLPARRSPIRMSQAISLYSYGAPRVGNAAFAARYNSLVPNSWRITNSNDIIPRCVAVAAWPGPRGRGRVAVAVAASPNPTQPTVVQSIPRVHIPAVATAAHGRWVQHDAQQPTDSDPEPSQE